IRKFSDGIKGANEMIGAMQIADITLNALSTQAKDMEINADNLNSLDSIAKTAQFKNESLFGKELTLNLAGENVSLSLPLPSQISNENSLVENFSQKHNEINEKMTKISSLIEKASLPLGGATQNYDFENFDSNSFKNLFR
ncbi:flagellar FLiS export co-chaperone, partial [Helicobacter canadensis]